VDAIALALGFDASALGTMPGTRDVVTLAAAARLVAIDVAIVCADGNLRDNFRERSHPAEAATRATRAVTEKRNDITVPARVRSGFTDQLRKVRKKRVGLPRTS
jgi:hypothetical protein